MRSLIQRVLVLVLVAELWSASTSFSVAFGSETSNRQEQLNGGYYLLHHLCDDEGQLPLLIDVKHTSPEIEKFADRISKTAKETNAVLEQMQDGNKHLNFDRNPLPPLEQDFRASLKSDTQHQLLFGTSNSEFDRALLVTQIQASNYALTISKVMATQETSPKRIKCLNMLSSKWLSIHDESFRLLAAVK